MQRTWDGDRGHHDTGGSRGAGPPYRGRALDWSPHWPDLEVRGGLGPLKGHAGPWDGVVTGGIGRTKVFGGGMGACGTGMNWLHDGKVVPKPGESTTATTYYRRYVSVIH